jgi:hypothetical protein
MGEVGKSATALPGGEGTSSGDMTPKSGRSPRGGARSGIGCRGHGRPEVLQGMGRSGDGGYRNQFKHPPLPPTNSPDPPAATPPAEAGDAALVGKGGGTLSA